MFRNIFPSVSKVLKASVRHCWANCTPVDLPSNTQLCILPNGVRVATEQTNSSLASISLYIEAGPRFETACNNGITHFIEHMAYKGFNSMTKCQLQESLLLMGAKLGAHTTREIQIFSAKCLVENAGDIIHILSNVITDLALLEEEIEAERYNICLEMVDADNDPKQVVFDYLHQTAFQGTPLSQRVIGPTRNIQRFDRHFTATFLSQHYQPYKLALVSSGCLDHSQMVDFALARFGHMVSHSAYESDEGPCRFTGSQVIYRDDSMPFAHVAIAVEAPGYNSPEYLTLLAASYVVGSWNKGQGGGINNASPLAQAAATGNLCESFESFYIAYRDIGLWGCYFVCDRMKLEDMIYNIQNTWMNLCISTQFFDAKRGSRLAHLEIAKAVTGSINSCHDLGIQTMYRCGRKSIQDIAYDLSTINQQNVKETVERYIYDRCPAVVAVGPTENLPDYTRIRAGMYWLRL
ncbi:cytochrome b-c1 complex subunit 1, mitochondrial-like [Galleria mellonella]|uniref:Cytochrome b-c1 complex subunit 1, mitochondrial-like n=1 Tax=Galleria mellonella TaxID=7137 RepID=A0A6J3C8Y0_GALME|nr:cytochrome b-c1 complex subunit 1, mitochondrial-like [Galleria mellonella]